jgi:hypothetical protein
VGDWVALLGAIALVIGSAGTASAAVITALRSSPKERKQAAKRAVERFAEAAADGEITNDELAEIAATFNEDQAEGEEP